jgi:hypothetical protein
LFRRFVRCQRFSEGAGTHPGGKPDALVGGSSPCSMPYSTPAPRSTGSQVASTTLTAKPWPTHSPRCTAVSPQWMPLPAGSAAAPTQAAPPAISPPRTCSRARYMIRDRDGKFSALFDAQLPHRSRATRHGHLVAQLRADSSIRSARCRLVHVEPSAFAAYMSCSPSRCVPAPCTSSESTPSRPKPGPSEPPATSWPTSGSPPTTLSDTTQPEQHGQGFRYLHLGRVSYPVRCVVSLKRHTRQPEPCTTISEMEPLSAPMNANGLDSLAIASTCPMTPPCVNTTSRPPG